MATPMRALVLRMPSRPAGGLAAQCCSRATFSTTVRPVGLLRHRLTQHQTTTAARASPKASPSSIGSHIQQLRRSTHAAGAQTSAGAGPSSSQAEPRLDWNTFFKLRMRRRRIQVFFSVTMGAVGLVSGVVLLSTGLAEPVVSQIPLDPFISLGLMTVAFAGAGWLIGPTIGSQVFYLMNRGMKAQINQKEAEFFARIRKNRVDPSNSSAANPVPDFYGEKIQSVVGYRQWLKDQRAFNRKKAADLI